VFFDSRLSPARNYLGFVEGTGVRNASSHSHPIGFGAFVGKGLDCFCTAYETGAEESCSQRIRRPHGGKDWPLELSPQQDNCPVLRMAQPLCRLSERSTKFPSGGSIAMASAVSFL